MTTTQTPATLLALHDADPEGLNRIACKITNGNGDYYFDTSFSTSLDAVAELEAGLTDEEHEEFRQHLWEIVGLPDSDPFDWSMKRNRAYLSAPAHLRLIAWVLTKQTI